MADDDLPEDLARLVSAAESARGDDAAALILGDALSEVGDPRGELLLLDALDRTTPGGLRHRERLERLLLLAAEYTFPTREPEPPLMPMRVRTPRPLEFDIKTPRGVYDFHFRHGRLTIDEFGAPPLAIGWDREDDPDVETDRETVHRFSFMTDDTCTADSESWTVEEMTAMHQALSDWLRYRVPVHFVWFPLADPPPPTYEAGPIRVMHVPSQYTAPRKIARGRYGLAGRDWRRWIALFRRAERLRSGQ